MNSGSFVAATVVRRRTPLACALLLVLASCGAGTAGVVSSAASSGESNARTVASAPSVPRSSTSPASIFFELTDEEGDRADVEIRFDDGSGATPITLAAGSPALDGLATNGGVVEVLWDFAADLGSEAFVSGLTVSLTVVGGLSPDPVVGVSQGNDPPQVSMLAPTPAGLSEYSLNTDVEFDLTDSSGDAISVAVQYNADAAGGFPEPSWQFARPAVTPTSEGTPVLVTPVALAQPGRFSFKWDTNFDLAGAAGDVRLRVTPVDAFSVGAPAETQIVVDNNEPPRAVVDANAINGVKERGVVPIPITIFDDESDAVELVLQWRVEGEPFPDLPTDVDELRALVRDPARARDRRALQIAARSPASIGGRIADHAGLAANQLRLPELATTAAGLASRDDGLAGRTIAIERPLFELEADPWSTSSVLFEPAAAVRVGDGSRMAVLDQGSSGWRLRELDVHTGEVVRDVATGVGSPMSLALTPDGSAFFVGSSSDVFRVDAGDGTVTDVAPHGFIDGPRGLASVDGGAVLATGDDRLVRFDVVNAVEIFEIGGLAQPWGVVASPQRSDACLVAEAGANRVSEVDLSTLEIRPIAAGLDPADSLGVEPLPTPRSISLSPSGALLLVACDLGTTTSLRTLDIGATYDFDGMPDATAQPFVRELTGALPATVTQALAADERTLVALATPFDEPTVLGGDVVRATILDFRDTQPDDVFDPFTQAVGLTGPAPSDAVGRRWRIDLDARPSGSPDGRRFVYYWDTAELPGPDGAIVRAVPIDDDVGIENVLTAELALDAAFELRRDVVLPGSSPVRADLDADGDLDIATIGSGGDSLELLLRRDDGDFGAASVSLGAGSDAGFLAAGDFDADGDVDLVCVITADEELSFVEQTAPGVFVPQATGVFVPDQFSLARPVVADVDQDGSLDVVLWLGTSGLVLQQSAPGVFSSSTTVPGAQFQFPNPVDLEVVDITGDGLLDILVVATLFPTGAVHVFEQTGSGSFVPRQTLDVMGRPTAIESADLNDDGRADLAICVEATNDGSGFSAPNEFFVYPGLANGDLDDSSDPLPLGVGIRDVCALDLDRDGDTDLALAEADGGIRLLYQEPAGSLSRGAVEFGASSSYSDLAALDVDGDGDLDLVADGRLEFHRIGAGTPPLAAQPLPQGLEGDEVASGDLDGDGDTDFVVARGGANRLTLFMQSAPGVFDPTDVELDIDDRPDRVAVADLDRDGDLDIAYSTPNFFDQILLEHSISVLRQVAPGEFALGVFGLSAGFQSESLEVVDLDGDGGVDILSAGGDQFGGFGVYVKSQDPSGFFSSSILEPTGATGNPLAVATGDLDGDGRLDVVLTSTASGGVGAVTIFEQNGDGSFTESPNAILVGAIPVDVAVEDLDGDGDLDIVTTDRGDDRLTVILQVAPGSFVPQAERPVTGDEPTTTVLLDFDRDGDVDIATANAGSDDVSVFLQTAPGVFGASPLVIELGAPATGLAAADLDQDGSPDLVTGTRLLPLGR